MFWLIEFALFFWYLTHNTLTRHYTYLYKGNRELILLIPKNISYILGQEPIFHWQDVNLNNLHSIIDM